MNANELADLLDQATEVIKKQQSEIEALRNQLWDLKSEPWGFDRKAQEK